MNGPQSKESLKTDILLPSAEYVLQSWKVKAGTAVRRGETIAMACRKDAKVNIAPMAATTAPKVHKRPNRRRRIAPSAAVAATISLNKTKETSANVTTNIHQRLTEKLLVDKNENPKPEGPIKQQPQSAPISKENQTVPILATATGLLRTSKNSNITLQDSQKELAIGYVEECLHPAFVGGLCVVCGSSMIEKDDDDLLHKAVTSRENAKPDSANTVQVTVSGGVTMTITEQEGRRIAQQDSVRLLKQKKLSLVLDLDHTLVHATSDVRALQYVTYDDVRTLRLPLLEGIAGVHPQAPSIMSMQHHVKLRPHIRRFLQSVQPMYELTVYTAGTRQYAEEITIVLCRHLVGSRRDVDDLVRLQYEVGTAEAEYAKYSSLMDQNGSKKRKADDTGDTEPFAKRKKLSFGMPQSEGGNKLKSDHMTLEKLNEMKKQLKDAEDLERKARDLKQKLFGSRVVSRTDVGDLGRDVKSLKRIFPCGGTMAAVVDDREDVWANASDNSDDTKKGEPPSNLLLVRPYHWQPFLGFADVNNAAGVDLSGTSPTISGADPSKETDVQLLWTGKILKELHKRYYEQNEIHRKTVPKILTEMRREVLNGSTLVLSGLVPLHKKALGADSPRPPIVRYAQSLGAQVRNFPDEVYHRILLSTSYRSFNFICKAFGQSAVWSDTLNSSQGWNR